MTSYPTCPVCKRRFRKGSSVAMWSVGRIIGKGPNREGVVVFQQDLGVMTCMTHPSAEVAKALRSRGKAS